MKTLKQILEEEQNQEETLSDEDLQKLVDELTWEDIHDLYDEDEIIEEDDDDEDAEDIKEAISAQARLAKRMAFARSKAKRNTMRGIKLRRTSDPNTLRKRAHAAARRSLAKKFLGGRSRTSLSPGEKDMLEARLNSMKTVTKILAMRMVPKVRKLEQSRLYKKKR